MLYYIVCLYLLGIVIVCCQFCSVVVRDAIHLWLNGGLGKESNCLFCCLPQFFFCHVWLILFYLVLHFLPCLSKILLIIRGVGRDSNNLFCCLPQLVLFANFFVFLSFSPHICLFFTMFGPICCYTCQAEQRFGPGQQSFVKLFAIIDFFAKLVCFLYFCNHRFLIFGFGMD